MLWVHYFDPHRPYDPPEPYRSRFASAGDPPGDLARDIAAYDAEIAFTDDEMAGCRIFLQAELDEGPRGNSYGVRRGP